MIIVCPTVPHTGTHFMHKLLAGVDVERVVIVHPYPDQVAELKALVMSGNPCIIPLRHSDDVRASWKKYGKDVHNFAGMTIEEWYIALYGIADAAVKLFYIEIDSPDRRDVQLAEINHKLGLELETDWEPVRQAGL